MYQTGENTFEGSLYDQNYKMTISKELTADTTASSIVFSVNEEAKSYYITKDKITLDVDVYENGELIFEGTDHSILLAKEAYEDAYPYVYNVVVGNSYIEQLGDGFPSISTLHSWNIRSKPQTRAALIVLIPILFLLAYALVDFLYPDFFFRVRYMFRFDLENPEPSDWYYTSQKIGRVICIIGAVVLAVTSFYSY